MNWIVVAIVIILILIILILIPKAFKPYKKIGPSVAKHTPNILIKLYVVLAIGFALIMLFTQEYGNKWWYALFGLIPIPIYYFIKWLTKGHKLLILILVIVAFALLIFLQT